MLEVKDLTISFAQGRTARQEVVKHVSFTVADGEILGLAGGSGSGKTMTALAVAGLFKKDAILESGQILLDGTDLLKLPERELRKVQGDKISMIFQEPMTSLDPTMKIGKQVEEALLLHTKDPRQKRREKALQALEDAELKEPELLYHKYPHELSGGQRQRVMIAAAIVCRPKLLIADEPTTALDVGTQDEILKLLQKMKQKYNISILFISHNLRVLRGSCSRIVIMKDGELIEEGDTEDIFRSPRMGYTKSLIEAIPAKTRRDPYHNEFFRSSRGEEIV